MQYIDRLDDAEARYRELDAKMADPAVINEPDEYRKVAKAHSELGDLVSKYRDWKKARKS